MSLTPKDIKYLKKCIATAKIFSTCDKKQFAAIIIDTYGHEIANGYNGSSSGIKHCNEGACPRLTDGNESRSNYDNCIALHAEQNCLLFSDYSVRRAGGTLYVNGTPCYTCAKLISNSGIKRLVFLVDRYYPQWPDVQQFLAEAKVQVLSIEPNDLSIYPD